jgi:general secretion pathway protein L
LEAGKAVFERNTNGELRELFYVEIESRTKEDCRKEIRSDIERLVGKGFRIVLAVPEDLVLTRNIKLPMAVEENLRQTVGFELDRFTPFKPEQAYFDVQIIDRDHSRNRLSVRLHVAKRTSIDPLITLARELGLSVAAATPSSGVTAAGAGRSIDLLHDLVRSPVNLQRIRWWRIAMASVAITLIALFLIVPVWQKRSAAIGLLSPLAEAKLAAHETDILRDRLKYLVDEHNRLLDKKWSTPSTLIILEELSRRLGDDTYLNEFSFDGKSAIHIQGESAAAASLVEGLENSHMFKEVGFKSQLTKLSGTPVDRFHIAAVLENETRPKRSPASEALQPSSDARDPVPLSAPAPVIVVPDTTARTITPRTSPNRQ